MARCVRTGNLVSVEGRDELPSRLRRPAAANRCALRLLRRRAEPVLLAELSQQRTFRFFEEHAPGKHALHVPPDYAHPRRLHRQNVSRDVSRECWTSSSRYLDPRRVKRQSRRHALVDGIVVPVNSDHCRLMAASRSTRDAAVLLPGNESTRWLWHRAMLLITVINYELTDIGKYIEFSIGIACTRGSRPAPPLLPFPLRRAFGFGQYVLDLPVAPEISVKGGKGIWGMPKHQASLDFVVSEEAVSSQYDKDGSFVLRITIDRPRRLRMPISIAAANYCQFRGLLMKSYVYMSGKASLALGPSAAGTLELRRPPQRAPARRARDRAEADLHRLLPQLDRCARRSLRKLVPELRARTRDPTRRARERDRPGARRGLTEPPKRD